MRPRIAITAGEPAGIGPDLCCQLLAGQLSPAASPLSSPQAAPARLSAYPAELVIIADADMLQSRADLLGLDINIHHYQPGRELPLSVAHHPCPAPVRAGELNAGNASYVVETLTRAARSCMDGEFAAIATAPVHKGIINTAGIAFSGHTELFGELCRSQAGWGQPVMMLATRTRGRALRVALATTHLPLHQVSAAINADSLQQTIRILHADLRDKFGIAQPHILVCGLNPHAGEDGHMGREEIDIINPTLAALREQGIKLSDALPADTLFTPQYLDNADAVLAMYHDQGLPVLKYAGFGSAVNITLGLPIIRTSVDHGTALTLAGSGNIHGGSFAAAIEEAIRLCQSAGVNSPPSIHTNRRDDSIGSSP